MPLINGPILGGPGQVCLIMQPPVLRIKSRDNIRHTLPMCNQFESLLDVIIVLVFVNIWGVGTISCWCGFCSRHGRKIPGKLSNRL